MLVYVLHEFGVLKLEVGELEVGEQEVTDRDLSGFSWLFLDSSMVKMLVVSFSLAGN